MNLQHTIKSVQEGENLSPTQIEKHWKCSLQGNTEAQDKLKYYYMKLMHHLKPIYSHLPDEAFYSLLDTSVTKALERGLKFQVEDYEAYMTMASQTYFKYHLQPETDTLHLPNLLIQAFSRLNDIYHAIPTLEEKSEPVQIQLLSMGFEYPIFLTRLLFYSFLKWKKNTLRQVDIDLTVSLLPSPQRIEWEIFYEKTLQDIEATIRDSLEALED